MKIIFFSNTIHAQSFNKPEYIKGIFNYFIINKDTFKSIKFFNSCNNSATDLIPIGVSKNDSFAIKFHYHWITFDSQNYFTYKIILYQKNKDQWKSIHNYTDFDHTVNNKTWYVMNIDDMWHPQFNKPKGILKNTMPQMKIIKHKNITIQFDLQKLGFK